MKLNSKAIMIGAGIAIAMATEGAVLYIMLAPSPKTAAAQTEAKPEEAPKVDPTEAPAPADDTEERPVDVFNCSNNRVAPGATVHVSFKLTGVVPKAKAQDFYNAVDKTYKTRVKQIVERIIRSATLEELHDPNLSALRRSIKEDLNKLLAHSYLIDVTMSDFRLIEQ